MSVLLKAELDNLVSKLCIKEGKKSQVGPGDMREILKSLAELDAESTINETMSPLEILALYGDQFYSQMTGGKSRQ